MSPRFATKCSKVNCTNPASVLPHITAKGGFLSLLLPGGKGNKTNLYFPTPLCVSCAKELKENKDLSNDFLKHAKGTDISLTFVTMSSPEAYRALQVFFLWNENPREESNPLN